MSICVNVSLPVAEYKSSPGLQIAQVIKHDSSNKAFNALSRTRGYDKNKVIN